MDFLIEQLRPPAQRDHILVRQVDWISLAQFEQPSQVIERVRLPRLCDGPVISFKAECHVAPDGHRLDAGAIVRVAKAEQDALAAQLICNLGRNANAELRDAGSGSFGH